jgi:hypothetical protein
VPSLQQFHGYFERFQTNDMIYQNSHKIHRPYEKPALEVIELVDCTKWLEEK